VGEVVLKTARLGKTELEVSRVAMGGIPIQRPPLEEAIRVINRGLDLGVNLIDTSIAYGDSEIRIGKAIEGRRDDVVLATKGSWRDKASVRDCIDRSLERLKTDRIDLWQMHNIRDLDAFESVIAPGGSYEVAQEALESGKILHLGFSTHNLDMALKGVESGLFETVQFPFNFIAREAAEELIPLARECDVGFIGMKPFAGGNIADANLAIKYVLQYDNVVPDPGVEKVEEIEEIVGIVDGSPELTPDDWGRMDAIRDELGTRFCRQCMYCMPCPQGVEIWLLTYMKNLFRLWPRERVVSGRFTDAAETAVNCIQCGECEERCPYGLPIRELIQENYDFFKENEAI
jgi:predicted aldo/keto reductase-like oxidoreductase